MTEAAKGVVAIVAACLIWGFATLYYKAMAFVPPLEVLSHRVLWTLVFFGTLLAVQGRFTEVWRLIFGPKGLRVAIAGSVIALNWGIFIWAIQAGYAVESSLGYYILPLVSVVMGVALMGERLMPAQAVAVALAALAVLVLTYGMGVAPWIALILAFSFAPYLVLKKEMAAPAVVSVTAEVLVLAPLAIAGVRYKPEDFRLVAQFATTTTVLAVRPGLNVKTVGDLINHARKNPSQPLTYGSVGPGSLYHLIGEKFTQLTKINRDAIARRTTSARLRRTLSTAGQTRVAVTSSAAVANPQRMRQPTTSLTGAKASIEMNRGKLPQIR